jgi:hypothetical protein
MLSRGAGHACEMSPTAKKERDASYFAVHPFIDKRSMAKSIHSGLDIAFCFGNPDKMP